MTLRTALQCDVCAAQLRAVIDRRGAPAPVVQLADLVLELAAAVDNAAEDIGGSRPQLTILREAVEIATALKRRAETRNSWHEGPPPRDGRYRTRPIATKHECGNMPTRWRDGAWHWDGAQTKHRCDDQARQWFGRQR